jgi:S1-C subfamily serine protease
VTVSEVDAGTTAPPPARPRRRPPWWLVIAAVVVLIAVAVLVGRWTSDGGGGAAPTSSTLDAPTATAIDEAVTKAVTAQGQSVAEVFERIQPAVVEIDVVHDSTVTTTNGEDSSALGTGVIVNRDGSILTALHVVDHTTTIGVVYSDGTRADAEIAATDPANDIALLRPATLPSVVVPAVLGSEGVGVGLPVVAVGNPLGLDDSTTSGVISALDRSIRGDDGTEHSGLIQFDAAVNPGSSGGPLLNQRGEVIGVVVALADPTEDGYFIGIGFAVPIGTAIGAGGGGDQPPK